MVESPRELIRAFILQHPGANFREVLRGTKLSDGAGRHHVNILVHQGDIIERAHRGTLRYFENKDEFHDHWKAIVLLREPEFHTLHGWLANHQGATQKEILDWAAAGPGWSRSTTQHRLSRLVADELVTIRPRGRFKCYHAVPAEAVGRPAVDLGPTTPFPHHCLSSMSCRQ